MSAATAPDRLPRTVAPERYDLVLEPDLAAGTFAGREEIAVEVHEPVREIVLHADRLDITEASLVLADGATIRAAARLDPATEMLHLELEAEAPAGAATLHVAFAGRLSDDLYGFYRSTYTDAAGTERTIATTQFEATYARRAFPCWDEPDRKAVFSVTLVVAEGLLAISNAAELASEPTGDGRVRVRFADTMVMSTYLVAFVVGPLEATEAVDVDGVPLRIVHRPGQQALTPFALDVGAAALRHFSAYYEIPYPGDKLDLIAIPDFAFGAMENLGCVTFREVLLLVDPATASQPELERVADVINHEIAHMWFGDLVTMRWWNGIWLNEAFATFMEVAATDAYRPDWDRWIGFGVDRSGAFDTDSLRTTRPIEYPVASPADAEGMFDVLTYEKGGSVLRMLEQYLGPEAFRRGIAAYLDRHRYANTETTDLWDALEASTGEPVRRIMDSWIFQGGHPIITVTDDAAAGVVRLRQEHFTYADAETAGAEDADVGDEPRWAVPVLVRAAGADSDPDQAPSRVLLDGAEATLPRPTAGEVLVVNAGGHGFYRVRYAGDLLARVGAAPLSPLERYQLVEDTWAALLAGAVEPGDVVTLLRTLAPDEDDLAVWQRIVGVLGGLARLTTPTDEPALQALVREVAQPTLDRLGERPRAGEADRETALRAAVFRVLGTLGADEAVQASAADLEAADAAAPGSVDAALLGAAVDVLAPSADATRVDRYLARYQDPSSTVTPQERLRYLGALADVEDLAQLTGILQVGLDGGVRGQDLPIFIRRALLNRTAGPAVWAFVHEHWDQVVERVPSNAVARLLEGVRVLTDPVVAADVRAFLAEHPLPQASLQVAQHLERLQINAALRERVAGRLGRDLA